MLRSVLGVVIGLLLMYFLVFAGLGAAFAALGADRTFLPGSYDVSVTWAALMIIVGLIAAILGGAACSMISGRAQSVRSLAIVVLVLGMMSGLGQFIRPSQREPVPARTADTAAHIAMTNAREPLWVVIVNPVVGVIGTLIGGLVLRPPADTKTRPAPRSL